MVEMCSLLVLRRSLRAEHDDGPDLATKIEMTHISFCDSSEGGAGGGGELSEAPEMSLLSFTGAGETVAVTGLAVLDSAVCAG